MVIVVVVVAVGVVCVGGGELPAEPRLGRAAGRAAARAAGRAAARARARARRHRRLGGGAREGAAVRTDAANNSYLM